MEFGFKNQTLDIRQEIDGIHFTPLEYLVYVRKNGDTIRSLIGFRSDGGSIPMAFQNIISARGRLFFTFVQHDACYQGATEILQPDGSWRRIAFNEDESNEILKEAALSQGANAVERTAIFEALQLFGWKAFSEDRANPSASAT